MRIFLKRLGGYDKEDKAARAYDLAALKYWGPTTHINFPVSGLVRFPFLVDLELLTFRRLLQLSAYEKEVEEMKHMTRQEFVAYLRRFGFE